MQRRDFLKSTGALAAGIAAGSGLLPGQTKKPNIIFILADDLGNGDVGCYGSDRYRTPNIDKLASEGTRFTHFYTAPLCGPSRALIQTARYAFRTGATNQDSTGLMEPSVETMWPGYLKPAGYVTASIGKWGQLPLGPAEFGYDEYLKFKGSGVYWNTQEKGKTYEVNGQTKDLHDKEYMPDVMHNYLVDFLTRRRDQSFCVYYSMSHVHVEILPTPDSAPDSKDLYRDNIVYMDKLVGKLMSELERLRLRDNMLVIFAGDNGTGGGSAATSTIGGRRLSGQKGEMLEGGSLVPLIARWPGRTPAGKVSADLIDSTDILPTLAEIASAEIAGAEIAGAKLPARSTLDGRSFAPQLLGQKGNPRDWIYIQLANQWYVREAGWKLNREGQLFNMKDAPFEEPLVPADTANPEAKAARSRLQAALALLNPEAGIADEGDGTGRHANREANRKKKKKN